MSRQKLVRFAAIGAVALAALAAAGYVFGDGDDDSLNELATANRGVAGGSVALGAPGEAGVFSYDDKASFDAAEESAPPRAAAADGDGALYSPLPSLQANDGRQVIQTASLNLEVDNVGKSFEEVGRVATGAGGFVASSSFAYRNEDQIASLTIRVPSARYQDVLSQLRGLGVKVLSEDSSANDVTEEYTDLNARLRNLEATESQLLTLLSRSDQISDILLVQDRLFDVRGQIEQVQGRMNLLDNLTDLATISVHLEPVVAGGGHNGGGTDIGDEISEAWDDSLAFLTDVAAGIVRVVVFAWWVPLLLAPLGIVTWFLRRPRAVSAAD